VYTPLPSVEDECIGLNGCLRIKYPPSLVSLPLRDNKKEIEERIQKALTREP
jgi:hypothetical protein